jgi:tRNA(fMet)-specific endonuclease VapC
LNPRYLLDSNIVIHIRQRRPPAVLAHFEGLEPGEVAMSVITLGELTRGVERSSDPVASLRVLKEIAEFIPVMALPAAAGESYGAFRVALERRGETIGNNDLWIAAHAHAAGLILVTNNEREFRRIPELKIENWTNDPV